MKIEQDEARFTGGLRGGETLGGPIAFEIANRDYGVWEKVMGPVEVDVEAAGKRTLTSPRPGHADLAGGLKYGRRDLRDILERASARESAARVAAGALCRQLLLALFVRVRSGVLSIGEVAVPEGPRGFEDLEKVDEASPFRLVDRSVEAAMMDAVDAAAKAGDTLGGTILVGARGVPTGLGSHVSWEDKLDGRIARALMSIPSVKAVSLGEGVANAFRRGSAAHDPIAYDAARGFSRTSNRAGGLEGGITNGEDLLATIYQKPISTLRDGLPSVVIAEAMLAFVLADALLEKTGGDSMEEVKRNFEGFVKAQRLF